MAFMLYLLGREYDCVLNRRVVWITYLITLGKTYFA